MNVKGDIILNFGKNLLIYSTTYLLLVLSKIEYFVCMEVLVQNSKICNKYKNLLDPLAFQRLEYYAIYCGQTLQQAIHLMF